MKKIFLLCSFYFLAYHLYAQKETFDITTYTPPKGWKKEVKPSGIAYTFFDKKDNTWCQITIYKNIPSKGSIEQDFNAAWQELIAVPYKTTEPPQGDSTVEADGWKIKAGAGKFIFNNANAMAVLTAFTGYSTTVDIVASTNAQRFIEAIETFNASIDLKKPTSTETIDAKSNVQPLKNSSASNFTYTTTNFDDGWVGTVKDDWVEVSKPGIKILIHYPNKNTDEYTSVLQEGNIKAWNILVVPKYSAITNFMERGLQTIESITFITANAIDKITGKKAYVVLYKKHYQNGNGRYLEIIADNQSIFENEFGNKYINASSWDYQEQSESWNKLANMQWRNKFSVSANDLIGTWTANDYASLSYYYVGSGGYAGATATSTADKFTFLAANNYESDHTGASGVVGNQQFSRQVYKGKSTITEWTLILTNRFKGATDKFSCQFEAIKGGRILLLNQIADGFKSSYALVKK